MEIAIGREGDAILIYVEGICWQALTEMFRAEWVTVDWLVYGTGKGKILVYKKPDNTTLKTQPVRMDRLTGCMKKIGLDYEPNVVKLGNRNFYLENNFIGAYSLKFWNQDRADIFLNKLARNYFSGMYNALKAGKPFSTTAITKDYEASPTFERFTKLRLDRWHDQIEKDYGV